MFCVVSPFVRLFVCRFARVGLHVGLCVFGVPEYRFVWWCARLLIYVFVGVSGCLIYLFWSFVCL